MLENLDSSSICIIGFITSIIWIVIAIWVHRDARARGDINGGLWLLMVLITGIIGLMIWLLIRPPIQKAMDYSCDACKTSCSYGQKYCNNCGKKFDWDNIIKDKQIKNYQCNKCKTPCYYGQEYCEHCGMVFNWDE